jgi:hypothetical protein
MPPPRLAGDRGRLREQRDSQHNHHRAPILIAHLRRREAPIPSKSSQPAQRRHLSTTIHALAGNSVQSRVKKTRLNRRLPGACGGTSSTSAQIPRVTRFRTSPLAPANTPPGLSRAGPLAPSPWGATCKTSGPAADTLHPVPRSPRRNTTRIPRQSETPRRSRRSGGDPAVPGHRHRHPHDEQHPRGRPGRAARLPGGACGQRSPTTT